MRGAALTNYPAVAEEVGLDYRALLRRLDIDPRFLVDPEHRAPAEKVIELLEQSAALSGCETFGLRMAERRKLADYGPISLLLAHQPTVRDALQTIGRFQRMLNEALVIHIEDQADDLVLVREELVTGSTISHRQAYELAVGTLIAIFGGGVGPRLAPRSIHFTHGPPADLAVHRRVLGPSLVFRSDVNGFLVRRKEFDAPNPSASPEMAEHAERFIRTLPYADHVSLKIEVQKAIHVLLPYNGASVAAVADRLGLSERTLQRRLSEEGADFSSLLNDIRRQHALRYLGNLRVPIGQVAGLVGYGRETSFARWFAAEFGVTPSAWRTAAR